MVATFLLILLVACSGSNTTQIESQAIIVTLHNDTLPEGCSPSEVAHRIISFLDAYNNGDQEQIANFFPNTFEWYSDALVVNGVEVDQEHYFLTRPGSREALLNYIAKRHQQDDHLQLIAVNVVGPSWHGGADIVFRLTREADDIKPESDDRDRYVEGRGAVRCESQKFFVLSFVTRPPDFLESDLLINVCPEPPSTIPKNAVIACARN